MLATWDPDAGVWVATSDDVPGLITEADTLELLETKLLVLIPELLEANNVAVDPDIQEVPLNIIAIAHRENVIALRA